MTVAAWIESLKKFDPAMDVVVRMENLESGDEMMAVKPVFAMDIGCDGQEYLGICLMHEDNGIDEVEAAVDDLPDLPSENAIEKQGGGK